MKKHLKVIMEKKTILQEFKEFALKGNVVDLAVGVVVGAAFNSIVQSLLNDIIMPLVGLITSGENFTGFSYRFGPGADQVVAYGKFIQNIINFFIIALSVFIVVKVINRIRTPQQPEGEEKAAAPTETELLTEIRDLMKEERRV